MAAATTLLVHRDSSGVVCRDAHLPQLSLYKKRPTIKGLIDAGEAIMGGKLIGMGGLSTSREIRGRGKHYAPQRSDAASLQLGSGGVNRS